MSFTTRLDSIKELEKRIWKMGKDEILTEYKKTADSRNVGLE
jgi:hypothetical protein